MEGITITKRPRLRSPYLICAWPGMGDVAFKAASYLVEKLKAEEFAEIAPERFFYLTASMVKDGVLGIPQLPASKFYYWRNKAGKNDLIIFISNAQPDLTKAEEYFQLIIQCARLWQVSKMVGFAAMPQPIDHTQTPGVFFAATSEAERNELKRYNLILLADGQISGMNGLFLGIARREGFEGFCLLGETPLYTVQIENPKASFAVLEAFCRILPLSLDLSGLIDQGQVIENEINKLFDYMKMGTPEGPIGEEEIERIKKSLSQLTRLPASVKEKIGRLFKEATLDIKRAAELKTELDKWNVYKEYEDEFLDLFKKRKDTGN